MHGLRKSALSVAASCLLLSANSELQADNYKIDPSHTSIIFGISHLKYSYTYGRFSINPGSNFVWNNANPSTSQFQIAIPVVSIDSNDPKRDAHLRNADFFNANQFPQIIFQSTSVTPTLQDNPAGNKYDVVGNLMMHGVTRQITLPMKKLGEGPGPAGKHRCGFFCQTFIKRSDFGMANMIPDIGDQVAITISFEGVREGAAGSGSAPKAAGSGSAPKGIGVAR